MLIYTHILDDATALWSVVQNTIQPIVIGIPRRLTMEQILFNTFINDLVMG